jgi:hypothetical protein
MATAYVVKNGISQSRTILKVWLNKPRIVKLKTKLQDWKYGSGSRTLALQASTGPEFKPWASTDPDLVGFVCSTKWTNKTN